MALTCRDGDDGRRLHGRDDYVHALQAAVEPPRLATSHEAKGLAEKIFSHWKMASFRSGAAASVAMPLLPSRLESRESAHTVVISIEN